MSAEHRQIRPYKNLTPLTDLFHGIELHVDKESTREEGETLTVSYGNYLDAPIDLKFSIPQNPDSEEETWELADFKKFIDEFEKRLKQTELSPEQISFTIIATSNYLKILDQKMMTIQEIKDSPNSISLAERGLKGRWSVFQTPRHGCRVTFAAILNESIKNPKPLTPHRKGTWLARADFQLKSEIDETFKLLVEPLTEKERERLNLNKSISQYIEIKEGTIDPEIENTYAPIMYLDEELYDLTLNFAKTDRSKVFQRKLALDYITSITYNASKELTESNKTYEEIDGSLVASIISGINKNMRSEEKEAFLGLIQKEPEKFIATVEENLLSGMQKEWKELLLGEET